MPFVGSAPPQREWTNPQLLQWARKRVGLAPDQIHVVTRGQVSKQQLVAWESGELEPSLTDLELLARVYRSPVAYFFWERPPEGKDVANQGWDFRGLRPEKVNALDYDTRLALIRFQELSDQVASFLRDLGIQLEVRLDKVALSDDPEEVADRERTRLRLELEDRAKAATPDELFGAVRRQIEDMGVFVVALKVNPRQVRGVSHWAHGLPPAILVNRADAEAATGRLFTLLHEYTHLLARKSDVVCDFSGHDHDGGLEAFANKVAASILIPPRAGLSLIRERTNELGLPQYRETWSDAALDGLRKPFRVSRDVIAIFLEDHDMAPPGFYRRKLKQWESRKASRGFGRGRPLTLPERKLVELGTNFSRLLVQGHEKGQVPLLHVADLLDTTVEQAERFLHWPSVQNLVSH